MAGRSSYLDGWLRAPSYVVAAPLSALLYLIFVIGAIAGQTDGNGEPLPSWFTWMRVVSFGYFAYWTWTIRGFSFTERFRDFMIGSSVLIILFNISVFFYFQRAPWQAFEYAFLLVAVSLVVFNVRWFLGLSISILASLLTLTWVLFDGNMEAWNVVVGLGSVGLCLSVFLFAARRSSLLVVDELKDEASRERDAAEQARADFQQLIERAPDAVLIVVDEVVHYANPAFLDILRRTENEVHQQPLDQFVIDGVVADKGPSRLTFLRKDGESVVVDFSPASEIQHELQPARLLMGRDVSVADQEMHARLQLADRMAAIGVLATGVAHEINNPLAYVIGNLALLNDEIEELAKVEGVSEELREEMLDLANESLHGAKRVATIVRDLNSMARFDSTSIRASVAEVLESSIRIAQPHLQHRAQVFVDIDDVPNVSCDPARLSQVFLNLIINAAHAIEDQGDREEQNSITITCRQDGDGDVKIEVRDTGKGMDAETQRRLFEPFYTTKEVGRGTGLGLYYCMNEIDKSGGSLSFESELGHGTTFRIVLPTSKEECETEKPQRQLRAPIGGLQVLIIDDELLVCRTLKRMLGGQDVTIAVSAAEAIRELESQRYDVIFCDLMMPEQTGAQLLAAAEKKTQGIGERFVFITGGAFTPESEAFLEQHPAPVIMKPFRQLDIEQALVAFQERSTTFDIGNHDLPQRPTKQTRRRDDEAAHEADVLTVDPT